VIILTAAKVARVLEGDGHVGLPAVSAEMLQLQGNRSASDVRFVAIRMTVDLESGFLP
jgi:hypothetical protein